MLRVTSFTVCLHVLSGGGDVVMGTQCGWNNSLRQSTWVVGT